MGDPDLARLLLVLRLTGHQGTADIVARRRGFERFMARLPQPPMAVRRVDLDGVNAEEVTAGDGAHATRTILYLHGGGYCLGSPQTHRGLAARLAAAAAARVVVPEYRLAPEQPFPAAIDDALRAWRALVRETAASRLALGGDSAGGGLAVVVAGVLRDAGEAVPAALFALSPWTDLTSTAPSIDGNAARDPLVDRAGLEAMARLYLGGTAARDPLASPLFGALRGLPPTLVQVGEHECLLDDARCLAAGLRAAGVPVELEVWPRMVHVWQLYAGILPAGERAIASIAVHVRGRIP